MVEKTSGAVTAEPNTETLEPIVNSWASEEYKLLNMHYFHEDNFFLKCTAHFMSINTGIVTIFGTKSITNLDDTIVFALPLIGFSATLTWMLTLLRVRSVKVGIEQRIGELELGINNDWKNAGITTPFNILNIRNNRPKGGRLDFIPSTFIMTILPALFSVIWLFLIIDTSVDYFS